MLHRATRVIALLALLAMGMEAVLLGKSAEKTEGQETVSFTQVRPLLEKYCYGCHGEEKQKGDLSLQVFKDEAEARKARPTWEKVLHNIQSREMPPENKPQPSDEERSLIARWIETKAFQI